MIFFGAITKAVSRPMKSDNPQNTVYITVEFHVFERWLSGLPIVKFWLALLVILYLILHN